MSGEPRPPGAPPEATTRAAGASPEATTRAAGASPDADERFMRLAIAQAELAVAHGDVPVGAVIVDEDGAVIATGQNERVLRQDPSSHAEMIALRSAAERI